jgi:hypothetical protein
MKGPSHTLFVIPAEAGISRGSFRALSPEIPAFAGMTEISA